VVGVVATKAKSAFKRHTWCRVDNRIFNVRIGPNYGYNKAKAPSAAALYDPIAMDVFCTKVLNAYKLPINSLKLP
jgi:hypothetical protein